MSEDPKVAAYWVRQAEYKLEHAERQMMLTIAKLGEAAKALVQAKETLWYARTQLPAPDDAP